MKKIVLFLFCTLIIFSQAIAKISFENPDINQNDEILFSVNHELSGANSYRSLFYTKLQNGQSENKIDLITYYPERMELLSLMDKKVLQIRNRYGIARYYTSADYISWKNRSFEIPSNASLTVPYSAGKDGKWFCYVQKKVISAGTLVLENTATGKIIELADNVLCKYDSVPVKWSPDGSILLYEKDGCIYFCSPDAMGKGVEVEERFRKIGRGTIKSVEWASEKALVYIDDYMVYRINARELYTMGLYSGIIGQGTPIGRLPFQFDPLHDSFSVNASVTGLVFAQDNRNFTYFTTLLSSCDFMDIVCSKPYTDSKASLLDYSVFWDRKEEPILWQEKLPFNSLKETASVIRMGANSREILQIEDSGKPQLSPDSSRLAFYAGNTVYVYDVNTWEKVGSIGGEKVINIVWETPISLYIGGEKSIRKWNIYSEAAETIALSSVSFGFWGEDSKPIAETVPGRRYVFNKSNGKWEPLGVTSSNPVEFNYQNGKYRVFCGTTQNAIYENALYVRNLIGKATTRPVFAESTKKAPERQKVALIFDAYDNADGLSSIITALKKYGVPGTFFINGEFIRRYPAQTRQIALHGFECASMFFTTSDLTDDTFKVDSDFIRRGLGRNEDEFFQCTGSELSLYWHAPYYKVSPEMTDWGKEAGYEYITTYHAHTDNVTMAQIEAGMEYVTPEVLIQEYVDFTKATRGGIIPITVGISQGGRPQNLWENMDLLINALLNNNFELVTLSKY